MNWYFDNCSADQRFAESAMSLTGSTKYHIIKGWFEDTLPTSNVPPIALLRLDGDWYDSTLCCLENLFPHVVLNGMIIIDDYYMWDGCARAVHDYLSVNKLAVRIRSSREGVCYIKK